MAADLAGGLVPALGAPALGVVLAGVPATAVLSTLPVYAAVALVILAAVPASLSGPGAGHATRITLARLALFVHLVPLAFGGLVTDGPFTPGVLWWIVGVGTAVMVLDGVDGRVARRTGTATSFGARLDMEADAFLLLVLSALVLARGDVGAWVLLVGGMRYLFVTAGWAVSALREDLPPSLRRKAVCVVQGVVLLVCLGPIVPGWLANGAAAVALALLAWSFGADAVWLLGRGAGVGSAEVSTPPPPHPPGR